MRFHALDVGGVYAGIAMKAIVLAVILVGASCIWVWKVVTGRRRLKALESGNACMACNGTDVTPEGKGVRCNACGTLTDLTWLNSGGQVDSKNMREMAKPDVLKKW